MNTENTVASSNDEVVFDHRNKLYGAYSIRKSYTSSLTKGSGGSLLVIGLFIAAVQAALMLRPDGKRTNDGLIKCGVIEPLTDIKIKQDQPAKKIQQQPKTNAALPPRAVAKPVDPPVEDVQPQRSTNGVDNGPSTAEPQTGPGIEVTSTPDVVAPPQTVDMAEVMPQFEGGASAMYRFLRRHLRYPHTDQQGTVYVRFVIDITGTVTGVEVIRGVSGLLDREASRVIAIMPKWKPGAQHGAPVNVRMILPIKFEQEKE